MLIYKKIPEIMGEVGAIEKNRRGDGINYKFRGIDDIYMALQPLLAKHGVFYTPNVLERNREERPTKSGGIMTYTILKVEYSFFAEDGSFVKMATVGEAMDTSDKSSNKAMSAALKYAMLQLFCIPTEEEKDTEYQNHQIANSKAKEVNKAIAQVQTESKPISQSPKLTVLFKDEAKPLGITNHPLSDYVIPIGKQFMGKKLKEIPIKDLKEFYDSMQKYYTENKIEPKGQWIETLTNLKEFLG